MMDAAQNFYEGVLEDRNLTEGQWSLIELSISSFTLDDPLHEISHTLGRGLL